MNLDIKIEQIETSKLINYALNAKLHPPEQVEQIAASIKKFGFINPVIIDSDFTILAGHGRVMAARKLDMHTVPVIQVGHLSDIEKKAFILVDNKTQMNTGFDMDILKLELQAIQTSGFEIKPLGFSTLEMRELFSLPEENKTEEPEPEEEKKEEEPDEAPVPQTLERRVNTGDVWKLGNHTLVCGDSSDEDLVFKYIGEKEAHSIVTDPPYGLGTIKDIGEYLKSWLSDSSTDHLVGSGGFMGKEWDKEVPPPSLWKTWITRARPGAHALVFAGTRTQDLMGMSLRMSGLELRDIISWIYGSGFPKSLDVSKAIDKNAGAERTNVISSYRTGEGAAFKNAGNGREQPHEAKAKTIEITAPATESAKQWNGWGTAIKPALEPITLCRVPISEDTITNNVLKWGTGALNINACRIGTENLSHEYDREWNDNSGEMGQRYGQDSRESGKIVPDGRFPSNVIFDDEAAEMLDEQSGVLKSGLLAKHHKVSGSGGQSGFLGQSMKRDSFHKDYGNDSRFASRFFYVAKPSPSEKKGSHHPTVKPLKLMRHLVKLVTPKDGIVLEPFCGSGTTLLACEKEGMSCKAFELDPSYCDIILHRWENMTGNKAERIDHL
jgi:site-specific DNA-methyltransferase (adenine-specific)